jgi:hypothetical protein
MGRWEAPGEAGSGGTGAEEEALGAGDREARPWSGGPAGGVTRRGQVPGKNALLFQFFHTTIHSEGFSSRPREIPNDSFITLFVITVPIEQNWQKIILKLNAEF